MSKTLATVQQYMTPSPHTIGDEQPLGFAQQRMKDLGIRHLPVLRGGELVGVLTERDVQAAQAFDDVDPRAVTVGEVMTPEPFAVRPGAALDDVAAELAERRYGCAVVMQNEKVVGIFTTVDGMRALSELLRGRSGH